MRDILTWLSERWLDLVVALGGLSGYAAVWMARSERQRNARQVMSDRLLLTTTRTSEGALRVRLDFTWADQGEPLAAIIRLTTPAPAELVYNPWTLDPNDANDPRYGRELEVPLHFTDSGAYTAFFVIGSRTNPNIESGIGTIRVVSTASRKEIMTTTRTISARA